MRIWKFWILAACAASLALYWNRPPQVVIDKGEVQIRNKYHFAVLKKGTLFSAQGMLLGMDKGHFYYHAWIAYLPMDKVQELLGKYPDFYRCDSPGANEAKASTLMADLVAADRSVENKIRQAKKCYEKAKKSNKRSFVTFKGTNLRLYLWKMWGMAVTGDTESKEYLVEAIECEEKSL